MNNSNDITNTLTEVTTALAAQPEAPATRPAAKAKAAKALKVEKTAKPLKAPTAEKEDGETTDRLPTTLKELKETKGGFVASLFLAGKDKDGIAKELKAAFKLSEAQAVKVTRRITGRLRLYQRILELVPMKK